MLNRRVDVVLLDRRLPGESGDEVLGRIRERGFDCQVAMVIGVEPDFDILKLDVEAYLTKPVNGADLRSTISNLVNRRDLEEDLQTYLTLAAKKVALEGSKSATELRDHTEYGVLDEQLVARRKRLTGQLLDLSGERLDTIKRYRRLRIARDGAGILLVPLLLAAIHWGLPNAADVLNLNGMPPPGLPGSFLATFVHLDTAHLLGNVLNYLVVAPVAYFFSMRVRRVRWFYVTAPLLVTILPLVTMELSRKAITVMTPTATPVFIGFSDAVAGFVGFAYLAFLVYCRIQYDLRTVFLIGVFLAIAPTTIIFRNQPPLGMLSGAAAVLIGVVIAHTVRDTNDEATGQMASVADRFTVLIVATILFAALGVRLVPMTEVGPAFGPRLVGHLLGVIAGLCIGLITAILTNTVPVRERLTADWISPPRS